MIGRWLKRMVWPAAGIICLMVFSCSQEDNPPRDEIPLIKDALGAFEKAVRARDRVAIDSLLSDEAVSEGESAGAILDKVYPGGDTAAFETFGRRSFFYTKGRANVDCFIMADSIDPGRPIEIILEKKDDRWLIRSFDRP